MGKSLGIDIEEKAIRNKENEAKLNKVYAHMHIKDVLS
jgi:hypothetical protein